MTLRLVRVDDRLVHGQITTFWTRNLQANMILVADDTAAADPMQKNLMKIAAPSEVGMEVLTVDEAAERLNQGEWQDKQILMLVRGPVPLLRLVEAGVAITDVNVGNVGGGEGKERLTKQVAATADEMEAWHTLDSKGVNLTVQWLPNESKTDLNRILKDRSG
jgi:mannose/fructose/N-acetylgalactosamine-specific phosphotransferase system component IIB